MCHKIDLQISVVAARCTEWMLCMAPTAELGSCHRHLLDFDVIVVILEKTYVLAETKPDDCLRGEKRKIQCIRKWPCVDLSLMLFRFAPPSARKSYYMSALFAIRAVAIDVLGGL